MTKDELSTVVHGVSDVLKPYFKQLIMEEMDGRVHAAAMQIVTDETESVIRSAIRDAVRARVEIGVSVKK